MQIYDVKKTAELLSVKPSTLYQWAELGQIPSIRLNGALRFDLEDIVKWVQSCKRGSDSEYTMIARTAQRPQKGG